MPKPKDNVTMKTIAEEAGVTLTTVSRILNNKGDKYAAGTKEKIFAIAERLKYRPNALVHGMQTGKTNTAGVMIPNSNNFYSLVIEGIHEQFLLNDIIMLHSWNSVSLNKKDEELERSIIHKMVDRRVDGIILRPSSEEFERSYFEEIWERDIPLILIDREMSKIKTDFVGTDDHYAGRTAAEHLISLGHQRMLFIGAGGNTSTSRHREEGFRQVLSESLNASTKSLALDQEDIWPELHNCLTSDHPPTAIFAYNDEIARETAHFILESGFNIPEDISIIGCGNTPTSDFHIPLTTFDQHPQEIGNEAAKAYLARVNESKKTETMNKFIKPDLIIRNSTKAIG